LGNGRSLVSLADAPQRIRLVGQVVCLVRVQKIGDGVEPENDRSNNLFSDDWREGVFGQIPYLKHSQFPIGTFELNKKGK